MSNLSTPADQWLEELFEYELCDECGRDAPDHVAIPLSLGAYGANWFARCKFPITESK